MHARAYAVILAMAAFSITVALMPPPRMRKGRPDQSQA